MFVQLWCAWPVHVAVKISPSEVTLSIRYSWVH